MDATLLAKTLGAGVAGLCVMVLAITGKIDGPTALAAVQWVSITFLGGAALLGSVQAVATAIASPSATTNVNLAGKVDAPTMKAIAAEIASAPATPAKLVAPATEGGTS